MGKGVMDWIWDRWMAFLGEREGLHVILIEMIYSEI